MGRGDGTHTLSVFFRQTWRFFKDLRHPNIAELLVLCRHFNIGCVSSSLHSNCFKRCLLLCHLASPDHNRSVLLCLSYIGLCLNWDNITITWKLPISFDSPWLYFGHTIYDLTTREGLFEEIQVCGYKQIFFKKVNRQVGRKGIFLQWYSRKSLNLSLFFYFFLYF